jgi:hypothetical protein
MSSVFCAATIDNKKVDFDSFYMNLEKSVRPKRPFEDEDENTKNKF